MAIPDFFRKVENKRRGPNTTEAAFLALMSSIPGQSWFALESDEVFIAGINLTTGPVTLTMPSSLLRMAEKTGASPLPQPPSSTGCNPEEFLSRLVGFATR